MYAEAEMQNPEAYRDAPKSYSGAVSERLRETLRWAVFRSSREIRDGRTSWGRETMRWIWTSRSCKSTCRDHLGQRRLDGKL